MFLYHANKAWYYYYQPQTLTRLGSDQSLFFLHIALLRMIYKISYVVNISVKRFWEIALGSVLGCSNTETQRDIWKILIVINFPTLGFEDVFNTVSFVWLSSLPSPPPCLILPTPPLFSFLLPLHPTPLTLLMVYNKSTHPNIGAVQKTSIKWRMAQHWRIPNVAKYTNTS